MDKLVDFSQPIEAVHRNGRVQPARASGERPSFTGSYWVCWPENATFAGTDGSLDPDWDGWTIRNVVPAKPSTPSNEELTQRMEIPQAMAQRMAAHLRECDQVHGIRPRDATAQRLYDEMKSIVSDLPKPVDPIDPDLIEARKLAADCGIPGYLHRQITDGLCDDQALVRHLHLGISRGRTLAAGGTAHE